MESADKLLDDAADELRRWQGVIQLSDVWIAWLKRYDARKQHLTEEAAKRQKVNEGWDDYRETMWQASQPKPD